MLLKAANRNLIEDVQKTYVTIAASAGSGTLTVKDITGFAVGDYCILGEIGEEGTEIVRLHGTTAPSGTTITLAANTVNGHGVDTPLYRNDSNQAEFSRATTLTGSKSVLYTASITPDRDFTVYDDSTNTTGYGFIRWKNSSDVSYSSYSSGVNYEHAGVQSSYDPRTLFRIRKRVRVLLDEDRLDSKLQDDQIRDAANDIQRDVSHRRLWSFYETEKSLSSVADQFAYDIPSSVQKIYFAAYDTQPLANINYVRWKNLHWDSDSSSADPWGLCIWNNQMLLYPRPSSAAATTTLDGSHTAAITTITVASTSSFKRGDYYRFIIDSEVIYATAVTSTTFTGCLRGQEGTTATTHTTAATVTERNIVYMGHEEPVDLFEAQDRTKIPEPEIVALGAAAKLSPLVNKEALGTNYTVLYDKMLKSLEAKYSMKDSHQFPRIKNREEIVSDSSLQLDGNLYPHDLTSS